jgi:hypothetical protein
MTARQKRANASFRRIQRFLRQHSRALEPVHKSRASAALEGVVASLAQQQSVQRAVKAGRRSISARQRALRSALRDTYLRPIIAIAQARSDDTLRLAGLRMPPRGLDDTRLVIGVRSWERLLTEHRGVFLDEGFEDDFVEQLIAAANAITQAARDAGDCRSSSIVARFAIASLIREGRKLVRVLDALVLANCRDNPRLAAEWRAATAATSATAANAANS